MCTTLTSRIKKRLAQLAGRLFFQENPPAPKVSWKERIWSIGVYVGSSPFDFEAATGIDNPVLTCEDVSDVPANLIADPFMLKLEHAWYMFFEILDWETNRGCIGLATSEDGLKWAYQQIVLAEPFHLSYPYVFEWQGAYYLVPESYQAGSIRLYQASQFPTHWSLVGTLLNGGIFLDTSIFRHDDKWWLFTSPDRKGATLSLYYAHNLLGPWLEHPRSPIIKENPHLARPAGRVVKFNGHIIRYAQDCYPIYGTQVRAFEITKLTTTTYRERKVGKKPIVAGSGTGWNAAGMHHVDAHCLDDGRWLACVDGWA